MKSVDVCRKRYRLTTFQGNTVVNHPIPWVNLLRNGNLLVWSNTTTESLRVISHAVGQLLTAYALFVPGFLLEATEIWRAPGED